MHPDLWEQSPGFHICMLWNPESECTNYEKAVDANLAPFQFLNTHIKSQNMSYKTLYYYHTAAIAKLHLLHCDMDKNKW